MTNKQENPKQNNTPEVFFDIEVGIRVPLFFSVTDLKKTVRLGKMELSEEETEQVKVWLQKFVNKLQQANIPIDPQKMPLPDSKTFMNMKFFFGWDLDKTGEWLDTNLDNLLKPILETRQTKTEAEASV